MALRSYERGFEDALELCLVKLREPRSLRILSSASSRLLGLVKELDTLPAEAGRFLPLRFSSVLCS